MARPKKLTSIAVAQIPSWVAHGLSAAEIAEKLGCTLGTLRVRCSQLGISLRRRPGGPLASADVRSLGRNNAAEQAINVEIAGMDLVSAGADRPPAATTPWCAIQAEPETGPDSTTNSRARLLVTLSQIAFDQLRGKATLKGMSGAMLASMLIEAIARDDLFTAVLDN
jgi:hypothetical protein